jgi:hypothetical protein
VLGAAVLLSGCRITTGDYDHTSTASYMVGGHVTSLRVDGSGGEIRIDASPHTTRVEVTETARYNGSRPASRHTVEGGVLDLVSTDCSHTKCQVKYEVKVPAAMAARLLSHGGAVTAHGVAGKLDVDSAGGKVTADGTAAKDVTVRSSGGGVSLSFATVPDHVAVDTAGGSSQVRLPPGGYAVDADPAGGGRKVGVHVDPHSTHTVKLDSHGGDISLLPAG